MDSQYGSYSSVSERELGTWVANYALVWVTYPVAGVSYGRSRAEYGTAAHSMLMRYVSLNPKAPSQAFPAALAYDWITPLLNSTDKAQMGAFFKSVDELGLSGGGLNPFNSQVAMARGMKIVGALAISGDGTEEEWALASLNRYPEYYTEQTGLTRSESDLGGEDGSFGQGNTYAIDYTLPHVLVAEEAWRTANGLSSAAFYGVPERAFLRRAPQYLADLVLPWAVPSPDAPGGRNYVLSKSQRSAANLGASANATGALITALTGVLKAADPQMSGLAQWLRDNRVGEAKSGEVSYARNWAIWKFVLGDRTTPVSPPALGMPLSRAGRDGKVVLRTGWDHPGDTYITFRAPRWMLFGTGMSDLMSGSFTIDRWGPQVQNQGGNDGHDWGSGAGAGPANTLVFVDPSENSTDYYSDRGGHRLLPDGIQGSIGFVSGGPHDTRDALRFMPAAADRDVDYVLADITRAYNSTRFKDSVNPARVSEVVRELVYFRPATPGSSPDRVVIFDRTATTETRFEKRWMLHTATEPSVDGSVQVGVPVRNGSGLGKWTYTGATRVTATNTINGSNGRTFLTPLLPSGRRIVKVGGPNGSGQSWQADSHEYEDPFGVTHKGNAPMNADTAQYIPQYRVEIIPTATALADVFLNVVEVANASAPAPTPAVLLSATGLVGVRVGDRIAVFNRLSGDVASGDVTVDVGGTYGIHFGGLFPSREYEVSIGGVVSGQPASSAGTLYLRQVVAAGTRIALRATGTVVGVAPAAPANLRVVR
jgi:hypothetical protein